MRDSLRAFLKRPVVAFGARLSCGGDVLLVSGRASLEILQKSLTGRISIIWQPLRNRPWSWSLRVTVDKNLSSSFAMRR